MSRTKRTIPERFTTTHEYFDVLWSKYWVVIERPLTKKERALNERDGVYNPGQGRTKYKRLWNKSHRAVERDTLNKVHGYVDYEDFDFDDTKPMKWRHLDWWYY